MSQGVKAWRKKKAALEPFAGSFRKGHSASAHGYTLFSLPLSLPPSFSFSFFSLNFIFSDNYRCMYLEEILERFHIPITCFPQGCILQNTVFSQNQGAAIHRQTQSLSLAPGTPPVVLLPPPPPSSFPHNFCKHSFVLHFHNGDISTMLGEQNHVVWNLFGLAFSTQPQVSGFSSACFTYGSFVSFHR